MFKLFYSIIFTLTMLYPVTATADQVNVNLATSHEISKALHIKLRVAEKIAIHCQYIICRKPSDLLSVSDVDKKLLKKIENQLLFSIMEGAYSDIDDC